jgi:hypothetical protein
MVVEQARALLLVAVHARHLRRFDLPSFYSDVCHPTSGRFRADDRITPHRALIHQRTCLLRMVQQNKNTLEFGQTSGSEEHMPGSNLDFVTMSHAFITHLSECYHLKCLRLRLSNDVSQSATIISEVSRSLKHKMKPLLTTSTATTSVDTQQQHHVAPLEELELPLPMLYSSTHLELVERLHRLLTSPEMTSSLRRLVITLPSSSRPISPRTFDNIIAEFTGLTSLSITLDEQRSFDASEALAKLVNLQKLEVDSHSFDQPCASDIIV